MLLHVVRETDSGIVVRGAKYETAAAYANQAFTIGGHDRGAAGRRTLWQVWLPQRADYITRGIDPSRAPSFDVTGDK